MTRAKVRRMRALKGDPKRSRVARRSARAGRLARTLKAGALASIVVAVLAPSASADVLAVPVADPIMATARAVAVSHWGQGEPCGGVVEITWGILPANVNARSTWFGVQGAPETYSQCVVVFNLNPERDGAPDPWTWAKLCTIEEHELGHLLGHAHVDDPADVMSPYYEEPSLDCKATAPALAPVVAAPKVVSARVKAPKLAHRPTHRRPARLRAQLITARLRAWGTKTPHAR
jgi:hypothetical protein